MKQEDKDLLLQDLCARLPYGVKVKVLIEEVEYDAVVHGVYADETVFVEQSPEPNKVHRIDIAHVSEVKPYLLPLSSMTKEQKREYHQSTSKDIDMLQDVIVERINGIDNTNKHAIAYNGIDWLNAHHFDYRGLIEKGLAIDATGLNIY